MKKMQHIVLFGLLVIAFIVVGCDRQAPTQDEQAAEDIRLSKAASGYQYSGVTGASGELITPDSFVSTQSHLGPGSIDITPASPTFVQNCIPFGTNTIFGFTGFIYRNVPAFNLVPGSRIAFDLGAQNDVDVRRNIYFATANINPAPAPFNFNVVSQGIFAASGWTQVVSDPQIPQNPRGNTVSGDYELIYTIEAPFSFPGGGLIVGIGASPPGAYADFGCEQVLVRTDGGDASGFFYARFFNRPDQSLGVLDSGSGGTGLELGGIVIEPTLPVDIDVKPHSCPNYLDIQSDGLFPVAIVGTPNLDVSTIDPDSVRLEGIAPVGGRDKQDVTTPVVGRQDVCDCTTGGDDIADLSFTFSIPELRVALGDLEPVDEVEVVLTLTGVLRDGTPFEGKDCVVILNR